MNKTRTTSRTTNKTSTDNPADTANKDLTPLSAILKNVLSQRDLLNNADQQIATKLWRHWAKLTKNTVLQHTRPVSFNQGRLVLWVEHSTLSQEAHFYIDQLKQNINTFLKSPSVKEIYFTLNKNILNNRKTTMQVLNKLMIK